MAKKKWKKKLFYLAGFGGTAAAGMDDDTMPLAGILGGIMAMVAMLDIFSGLAKKTSQNFNKGK